MNKNSYPVEEPRPTIIYQDLCIILCISEMVIFVSEWNLRGIGGFENQFFFFLLRHSVSILFWTLSVLVPSRQMSPSNPRRRCVDQPSRPPTPMQRCLVPWPANWLWFLWMPPALLPGWTRASLLKEIIDHRPAWLTAFLSARCQLCRFWRACSPSDYS